MRILLSLLFCTSLLTYGQNYQVVYVSGSIFNSSQSKNISVGDYLENSDQLDFVMGDASCFVLNLPDGRYVIKPGGVDGSVNAALNLVPKRSSISTRAQEDSALINLSDHFGKDKYLFFSLEESLLLNEFYYPLSGSKIIVARYPNNNETVTKTVSNNGQYLIINPTKLYGNMDSIPLSVREHKTELYIYDQNSREFKLISKFQPVFVDDEKLKAEIKIIINSTADKENLFSEISTFLFEVYGEHNSMTLKEWLNINLNLNLD